MYVFFNTIKPFQKKKNNACMYVCVFENDVIYLKKIQTHYNEYAQFNSCIFNNFSNMIKLES